MNDRVANRVMLLAFMVGGGVIAYRAIHDNQQLPPPPQVVRLTLSWTVLGALSLAAPTLAAMLSGGFVLALLLNGQASDILAPKANKGSLTATPQH